MGKLNASLADVKTEFVKATEGDHEMKIIEVDESGLQDEDNPAIAIISQVDEPGAEDHEARVYDRLFMITKKGEKNKFTLSQIKRYFIAVCGEDRANADDLDFDELVNGRFHGVVIHETYKSKKTGKEEVSSRLDKILPL